MCALILNKLAESTTSVNRFRKELCQLALVSRYWLYPARTLLLRSVHFSVFANPSSKALQRALMDNPALCLHIKEVTVEDFRWSAVEDEEASRYIPVIISRCSNLSTISICLRSMPSLLFDAIVHISTFETLRHLEAAGLNSDQLCRLLRRAQNLESLKLRSLDLTAPPLIHEPRFDHSVTSLCLLDPILSDASLEYILACFPNLHSFDISVGFLSTLLTPDGVSAVISKLASRVTSLSITFEHLPVGATLLDSCFPEPAATSESWLRHVKLGSLAWSSELFNTLPRELDSLTLQSSDLNYADEEMNSALIAWVQEEETQLGRLVLGRAVHSRHLWGSEPLVECAKARGIEVELLPFQ
jgi:hypothetical protein